MSTLTVLADVGARGAVIGFLLPITIVALVAYGVFELIRSREVPPAPVAAAGGTAGTAIVRSCSNDLIAPVSICNVLMPFVFCSLKLRSSCSSC